MGEGHFDPTALKPSTDFHKTLNI